MKITRRQLRNLINEVLESGPSLQESLLETADWFRDVVVPAIDADPDNWSITADKDYYVWGDKDSAQVYIPKGTLWSAKRPDSAARGTYVEYTSHQFGNTLSDSGKTKEVYTLGDAYWMLGDMNRAYNLRLPLQSIESPKNYGRKNNDHTEELSRALGVAHAGVEAIEADFARQRNVDAPRGFSGG